MSWSQRLSAVGTVVAVSSFYETEPVEFTKQPWFINCAVAVETEKMPKQGTSRDDLTARMETYRRADGDDTYRGNDQEEILLIHDKDTGHESGVDSERPRLALCAEESARSMSSPAGPGSPTSSST